MEIVGAAFGDERHLRSGAFPLVSVVVRRSNPELLNRIKSRRQYRSEGIAVGLVVHIHAVESDVALVTARAVHGSVACVLILDGGLIEIGTIARIGHAGLQTQQLGNATALQRNLLHLRFVERIANGGVNEIQRRRFAGHSNDFGECAYLELHIRGGRCTHQQLEAGLLILSKALGRHAESVGSRGN